MNRWSTCVGNGDETVTVARTGDLSTQFTGVLTLLLFGREYLAFAAALFRDLFDGPDVEYSEIIKEGQSGEQADCGDHVFMMCTKAAAIVAHVELPIRNL